MKSNRIQKFVLGVIAIVAIASIMFITGCDELGEKIGGGGHPQSFHLKNGRY